MARSPARPRAYPIRAVARMTGLSADTLRAWERRYGAVTPTRDDRGRMYLDADVERLKRLALLVDQGHAIGRIAALPDRELQALLRQGDVYRGAEAEPRVQAPLGPLIAALERYDLAAIEATLNRHAAVLHPRDLVFSVVLPLLRELGQRWQDGRLRPSQEHLVSATVRSVLGGLLRALARPEATPRVVFATLPAERHELGLLCAALLAASAGFGAVYLGPDLPEDDVAHAAAATGARAIVVSATVATPAARAAARRLARQTKDGALWVGGPDARAILEVVGDGARHIEDLDHFLEMLSRHAR